jgi:hypothetical protein
MLLGSNIYKLLLAEGVSDSHFDMYKEFIRRNEHPTPEEIAETRRKRLEIEESIKRRELESANQEALSINYSSNTRTQRLKAQLLG